MISPTTDTPNPIPPVKIGLIVTSINPPNPVMAELARGSIDHGWDFIVIGDAKSPATFVLDGCCFLDVSAQQKTGFSFAQLCPTGHYARKNIGYLIAIRNGVSRIVETDDDNFPAENFWSAGSRLRKDVVTKLAGAGWTNIYRYFSDALIWPRGLPLDSIFTALPEFETLDKKTVDCPIQQGLANDNPDVDAIYRLILPLPQTFRVDRRIALTQGTWCPFNSQDTIWWRDAFALLYLPAFCSFRMTDIWRSFVAQRIIWENDWGILFHEPTVRQDRNDHNLMRDFADEIPGYLNNRKIAECLGKLNLKKGVNMIPDNMKVCYEALIGMGVVETQEMNLLDAWLSDLASCD